MGKFLPACFIIVLVGIVPIGNDQMIIKAGGGVCIHALRYKANFHNHYVLKNSGLNNVHGQHVSVHSLNDRWRYFTSTYCTVVICNAI